MLYAGPWYQPLIAASLLAASPVINKMVLGTVSGELASPETAWVGWPPERPPNPRVLKAYRTFK